jgi:hypothetical protein
MMALPFLTGFVFYIKSFFARTTETVKLNHLKGDLFFDGPLKHCDDNHKFRVIVTKNGFRLAGEDPCQCKKYPNLVAYSQEVDQDI